MVHTRGPKDEKGSIDPLAKVLAYQPCVDGPTGVRTLRSTGWKRQRLWPSWWPNIEPGFSMCPKGHRKIRLLHVGSKAQYKEIESIMVRIW